MTQTGATATVPTRLAVSIMGVDEETLLRYAKDHGLNRSQAASKLLKEALAGHRRPDDDDSQG